MITIYGIHFSSFFIDEVFENDDFNYVYSTYEKAEDEIKRRKNLGDNTEMTIITITVK